MPSTSPRENKRLARLLRDAKLKISQACVENVDYSSKRELDKATIRQLATCRWVQEHQSVLVTGMTGVGKTYLACALAQRVPCHLPPGVPLLSGTGHRSR